MEHLRHKYRCAMKIMMPQWSGNRHWIGNLKREYLIGRELKHETVIETRDFSMVDGLGYLVMEFYPAPNLKQWMHEIDVTQSPLLSRVIETAGCSLQYMHQQGWVHRDVKPDNFLVGEQGAAKLIDFTLARKKPTWLSRLFGGPSKIQGTPTYMSPEQIRNHLQDHRSDIYSFGCVVFELTTGKPPYTGKTANELLTKHIRAPVPSLRVGNPQISERFSHSVQQLLAKQPADRPVSMGRAIASLTSTNIFENNK